MKEGNIILTGLAGCRKTTKARELSKKKRDIIVCDDHRYGPNWSKKSYEDYRKGIFEALNNNSKILDGTYYDAYDPENARIRVFKEIVESGNCEEVYILVMSKIDQVTSLVTRSINRAKGNEIQGACEEKPHNVARLLIKNIENYQANIEALIEFKNFCGQHNVKVSWIENTF